MKHVLAREDSVERMAKDEEEKQRAWDRRCGMSAVESRSSSNCREGILEQVYGRADVIESSNYFLF